jgi:LysR family hydrogen peroxide-inducible transcriptional activator
MKMKDLNFSLKQLRYFLVASQYKTLRKAANELKITQPSLSAQLKCLEEELGIVLFERSRGGVTLTPNGREMIPEARRAINSAEAILEFANIAVQGPAGIFRLGVPPSLGPYLLPYILPVVRQNYPEVKFFIREAVHTLLTEGLKIGTYDLIFTTLPLSDPEITVVTLFREPVYLVLSAEHPLANKPTISVDQLEGLQILTMEEHHLFYRQVEELCNKFKAKLQRDYEGTSLDAIRQMVFMQMGVAFMPALYIRSEIRDRVDLHVISIEGVPIFRVHALAWRTNSPLSNFFRSLATFFQQVCKKEFGGDLILQ